MALYQNRQWAVTDWGLTSVKPGAPYEYEIVASRLLETANHGETIYDWPSQLAEKTWVDFDAFIEAYKQALVLHAVKYKGTVDSVMLERSIQYARHSLERR